MSTTEQTVQLQCPCGQVRAVKVAKGVTVIAASCPKPECYIQHYIEAVGTDGTHYRPPRVTFNEFMGYQVEK